MLGQGIKRHQRGKVHADGDLWIVSYADMMTLLFGFFVILFSLSAVDKTAFEEVSMQLAKTFRGEVKELKSNSEVGMLMQARQIRALQLLTAMLNLGDVDKVVDKLEKELVAKKSLDAAKKAILKGLERDEGSILSKFKLSVQKSEDKLEIALPGSMLFRSGTATLTRRARKGLQRITSYLNRVKGLVALEVVGHTDSVPPSRRSPYPNNWALSAARAGSVAQELINNGVSKRMLLTRGMASLKPLFPERRANGSFIRQNLAKNRRVSIIIRKETVDAR